MSETKNNAKRIEYIDLYRGIGILLMIILHIGFGETYSIFCHAFNMPMFFFISGYLYKNKEIPFITYLKKKSRALLLPYLIFGIALTLISIFLNKNTGFSRFSHLFFMNDSDMGIGAPLWFFTAFFIMDIMVYCIEKLIKNKYIKAAVIVALALFGNYEKSILKFRLPWSMGAGMVGLGIFYIGYLVKKYKDKKQVAFFANAGFWVNTVFAAILTALIFLNGHVNMREGDYSIVPLFWINAILGSIVVLNYSRVLYSFIKNGAVFKVLSEIGREATSYVCLNQFVIYAFGMIFDKVIPGIPSIIINVINLVLTITVLFFANRIINNTKLRFIIGK